MQQCLLRLSRGNAGFSLIEILVALTLLGIAGTFVASRVYDQLRRGQIQAAEIQMNNFKGILGDFRRKCGRYPTTEQGLEALVKAPTQRQRV